MLQAPEIQGKASKTEPIAQEAAQVANGGQAVVAEEDLAEGTVLGILLPQLAVEVRALVAAWDLPTQALLLLHGLQGPHGSCGARLQPTGIDGGKCETQEQQAELLEVVGGEPYLEGRRGPAEGPSAPSKSRGAGGRQRVKARPPPPPTTQIRALNQSSSSNNLKLAGKAPYQHLLYPPPPNLLSLLFSDIQTGSFQNTAFSHKLTVSQSRTSLPQIGTAQ